MKRLIDRIRKADRRNLAIALVVVTAFGALNYGLAKLIGLVIDSNPHYVSISDAAANGYLFGFLGAFLIIDWMRRAEKVLRARFGRQTPAAAE